MEIQSKTWFSKTWFSNLWSIKKEDRLKVFYLALTFFLMTGCQAIWRPLKVSIFAKIVGANYAPDAKMFIIFFLIPLIILYSKLVDTVRRHQLVYYFTIFHGIGGILFYFLLSHPTFGIANTVIDSRRITGWLLYFFMESFGAFLSATFWSFADSVNDPRSAKDYYGFFVSGSKLGGIAAVGTLYFILSNFAIPDSIILPNAILMGSLMLFGAAGTIYLLMKQVPGYSLHGYEVAYQMEKQREREKQTFWQSARGAIDGLVIMLQKPYVMGIFMLVFVYEVIIVIFDQIVLSHADKTFDTAGQLSTYYASYYLCMHGVGLLMSFFGTVPLQRLMGVRLSLFICPVISLALIATAFSMPSAATFFYALVFLRALNYAVNHPTREILYIPTTKDIKFKSKAWTDAFGSRVAKASGSLFNKSIVNLSPALALSLSFGFCSTLIAAWVVLVYLLGKTFQKAVDKQEVIGQ